ncbi:hypothetical protein ACFXPW_07080 [Streptomyces goshikiensis]|uniref:hypothetical protein n=1 Tax=Streptomyces goshikiensis TaxID=1942 RepID=UPI003691B93E
MLVVRRETTDDRAVPTALIVTATGRFLIGTSDGRILECSAAWRSTSATQLPPDWRT